MKLNQREVERQLEQNRGDIDAIYEVLGDIKSTVDGHTATLDGHTAILNDHSAQFGEVKDALAEVLRRLPEPPAA